MFDQKVAGGSIHFPFRVGLLALVVFSAAQGATGGTWTFRGPQPIVSTSSVTSGRVISLAVDPRSGLTVYAGSGGGGVWKSTDGGMNWAPLTDHVASAPGKRSPLLGRPNLPGGEKRKDFQASLTAGSIAIDPVNPDILYVGTGEINACQDCYAGGGVLKSIDAGQTWALIPGPFVDTLGRGARIPAMTVNGGNHQVVLAAAFFLGAVGAPGIYRSADGGQTWQIVLNAGQATAVVFDPVNTSVAYAGIYGGGLYKSTDAGLTWKRLTVGDPRADTPANVGRVDLALAPSSPTTLYTAIADVSPGSSGGSFGLFKSMDGGTSWQALPGTSSYCTTTCGYNSVVAVDPGDPGTVFLGGVKLQRSIDGGQTWQDLSRGTTTVFPPTGQHAIAFPLDSTAIYTGNDGGVNGAPARASTALDWTNLNPTLGIAEMTSRVAIHPANVNLSFGGVQKSGIERFDGTNDWRTVACLDGGASVLNQSEPATVYASCSQVLFYQSMNTGNTWSVGVAGIDQTDRTDSTPPLVNDVTRAERLYFGTFRVYRSEDGGGSWGAISPALADGNGTVTAIGVSPTDPSVAYAGTSDGRVYITSTVTEAATDWTERTNGLPKRAIRRIVVDDKSPFVAYMAISGYAEGGITGHVFKTQDSGLTWLNVSGNLPNIPVNDLVIDSDVAGTWYAATDAGVFATNDSGAHWSPLGTGLPNVVVRGLTLHRPSRTLRAATHGRGVWDLAVPLAAGANVNPGIASLTPNHSATSSTGMTVSVSGVGFAPGATVRWNGADRPTAFISPTQLTVTLPGTDLGVPSLSSISVMNPIPGGGVSNALPFTVAPLPAIAPNGIVDSASYSNRPLVPGSIATITGTNLALLATASNKYPLPRVLGGTSVHVAFLDAPLTYVSPTSISFQVPWELTGQTAATVQVRVGEVSGTAQSMALTEFNPGIFSLDQTGKGQGYITIANQDKTPAQPVGSSAGARPAKRGEVVAIFCSGLGAVGNPPPSGVPASNNPFAPILATPSVTIGGQPAQITFDALAPGLVGVYVVNARVPDGVADSDAVPVVVSIGGLDSNIVTLAVQGDLP